MAGQLKASVELSLNDKLSGGIENAGESVQEFKEKAVSATESVDRGMENAGDATDEFKGKADSAAKSVDRGMKDAGKSTQGFKEKAVSAANAIDQAFSTVGAKIASLGVAVGGMALVKSSIDYEDSIIRIGTNAGMSGEAVNRFRRDLLAIATEAKVPVQELVQFSQVVTDNSIGLDVASESMRFMADAMQGLGISGQEAGEVFSVLVQKGASIDVVKEKLNNLAEIDSRLQGMGLSEFAKKLPQLMEVSDVTVDNIEDLYVSILTLNNGASNKQALTQYTAAMQTFANSRDVIRRNLKGFDVKDQNGELKSFEEIMTALVERSKEIGGLDRLKSMLGFDDNTMKAIKQFNNYSEETKEKIADLGDTSDAVSKRAKQNAQSMKSSLVSLQDNILKLSDAVLTKPIEFLANLLDKHPKGMEMAIQGVGWALAGLATLKAFSSVVSLISSIKGLQGGNIGTGLPGGKIGAELSGGTVVPVYVTNAESMGGVLPGQGNPLGGGQGNPSEGGGIKGLLSADTLAKGFFIYTATKAINDAVFKPMAQKGYAKMEEKGIDPAVPGVGNYYNLNPKARKKLWEEYRASHPDEPLPKGAPISAASDRSGSNMETAGKKWQLQASFEAPSMQQAARTRTPDGSGQPQKKRNTGSYWGGGIEVPPREQPGYAAPNGSQWQPQKKQKAGSYWGGGFEAPSMQQPSYIAPNASPGQPQAKRSAGTFMGGFGMPPMRQPSQVRVPESMLPPQITKTETTIVKQAQAKAELEGNATLEVNVNISGERPTAQANVKNNSTPLNIHPTGNARLARTLAI